MKTMALALGLCLTAGSALAQGIVVNKTDGTKVYYPADVVSSVGVYDADENPQAVEVKTFTVNGATFNMMIVKGGSFMMGCTPEIEQVWEDMDFMKPVHEVKVFTFGIGETEVTQELWESVMGANNPSYWKGLKRPVESVTQDDCLAFITKLNQLTGETFRLPTEAEWEFAARGGNLSQGYQYSGSSDVEEVAWYVSNCRNPETDRIETHPVATKKANELGLYDMSGNVYELCQDWYDKDYYSVSPLVNPQGPSSKGSWGRTLRGGSVYFTKAYCTVAFRTYWEGAYEQYRGFRLALTVSE